MNEACGYCGREKEVCAAQPCDIQPEPDFERLRELQNDYRAWQRDGDEA